MGFVKIVIFIGNSLILLFFMETRVENLRNAGVEVEYRRFERAGHGFGLGTGTDAEGWVDQAVEFWQMHIND